MLTLAEESSTTASGLKPETQQRHLPELLCSGAVPMQGAVTYSVINAISPSALPSPNARSLL